jgi:hypothetical protein
MNIDEIKKQMFAVQDIPGIGSIVFVRVGEKEFESVLLNPTFDHTICDQAITLLARAFEHFAHGVLQVVKDDQQSRIVTGLRMIKDCSADELARHEADDLLALLEKK